jgi:hypothetical protein
MRVSISFRRQFRLAAFTVCFMIDEVLEEKKKKTNNIISSKRIKIDIRQIKNRQ